MTRSRSSSRGSNKSRRSSRSRRGSSQRERGTVKWFNVRKGYGFIECAGEKDDIYVHFTGIKTSDDNKKSRPRLRASEEVEFIEGTGPEGRRTATDVTAVGGGLIQNTKRRTKAPQQDGSKPTSRRNSQSDTGSRGEPNKSRKKKKKRRPRKKKGVHTGTVKWFNTSKGFGFIERPGDNQEDIYVHYSGIHAEDPDNTFQSLGDGEEVEFRIENSDDGRERAVNVTGPDGAPVKGRQRRRRRRANKTNTNDDADASASEDRNEPVKRKPRRRNRRRRKAKSGDNN